MKTLKHWNSSYRKPLRKGWYQCRARDGRWNGETRYRAFGNGSWWIPLGGGWLTSQVGLYRWRGPCIGLDTKRGKMLEQNGGIEKEAA